MGWYAILALPLLTRNHTTTAFLRNTIPVCHKTNTGHSWISDYLNSSAIVLSRGNMIFNQECIRNHCWPGSPGPYGKQANSTPTSSRKIWWRGHRTGNGHKGEGNGGRKAEGREGKEQSTTTGTSFSPFPALPRSHVNATCINWFTNLYIFVARSSNE